MPAAERKCELKVYKPLKYQKWVSYSKNHENEDHIKIRKTIPQVDGE
jgi:hypothetical protein